MKKQEKTFSEIKKVLILRLSALGDTIHTLPLAYAIKQANPECKIGWVVEDKAKFFIENNPLIDYCYILPKKEWKKRGIFSLKNILEFKNIIEEINKENYDAVLDTQQLFKSASLLPFLNIKRKITLTGGREFSKYFANEIHDASHELFDFDYHVVKRNLEFAKCIGAETTQEAKFVLKDSSPEVVQQVDKLLETINPNKQTVVIAPATTWENKHWKESFWSETLDWLKGKVNIILTGTSQDSALIDRILKGSSCSENDMVSLVGKTNLEELTEVFKRCDVVVSPDSGSAHIAWAVSKPTIITIFTATAENRCAPYGNNCHVLAPTLDCRPCMKRKCKRTNDKNKCCNMVKAEELINLLNSILQV